MLTRSRRSQTCIFYGYINYSFLTCIFYINKNQVCYSDSLKYPLKCPTSDKQILQVSVPDINETKETRRRSTGTDTVSNVLIKIPLICF